MSYGNVNNMPPVVSPASVNAMPNVMPSVVSNAMPNAMPNVTVTENIYMFPYAKPKPVYNDVGLVLVLFILLVIISRGVGFIGKC
ncbi:hypothetical protein [Paenibacillus sp. YN15]|uniref:hypothetical protein n=1 Tax=Paenibacillus sp. YN15 TaxID=1742774 RepID=UPI000DCDD3E5|nr:hypothetical protein [Paenibacillus sp. YN15]RAV04108.1 hypothetical protein DQG13_06410 [Paenibacillus sp. YN15]